MLLSKIFIFEKIKYIKTKIKCNKQKRQGTALLFDTSDGNFESSRKQFVGHFERRNITQKLDKF